SHWACCRSRVVGKSPSAAHSVVACRVHGSPVAGFFWPRIDWSDGCSTFCTSTTRRPAAGLLRRARVAGSFGGGPCPAMSDRPVLVHDIDPDVARRAGMRDVVEDE